MEPAAVGVTVKEAGVNVPVGVGWGFSSATGAGCGFGVGASPLFDDPHPGNSDPATSATVPCMIWRRVSVDDSKRLHGSEMPVFLLDMDARSSQGFDAVAGTLKTGGGCYVLTDH
jgi:hypothetical protein